MIKVENIEVWGFRHAIRGMRNPKNSHSKSDSVYLSHQYCDEDKEVEMMQYCDIVPAIGKNDLDLMRRLYAAGTEHRKYLRQIFVSMDITGPVFWLSELDTYKVGTVRNSCSFMHKGVSKPFEIGDFSTHMRGEPIIWVEVIDNLNDLRDEYLKTKDPEIFNQIRCLLPSGYNQRFTYTMNYENVVTMIHQRENHRLPEWRTFTDILKGLPYVKEIMGE